MARYRFSRLFQPRNPLFWMFVLLNALSSVLSYLLRSYDLSLSMALLLALFALGNVIFGIRIALRLMSAAGE